MPSLKRRLTASVLTVGAALLLVPAAGQAAQVFGSDLLNQPNQPDCLGRPAACTLAAFVEVPAEGQLSSAGSPIDGVITKFRVRAKVETPAQVTLRVADVSPAEGSKSALATATGSGPTVTLHTASDEDPAQEFAARLAVRKGQHLGLDVPPGLVVTHDSSGSKFSYEYVSPLVDGAARNSDEFLGELLVQATVEPDADGDGFGDETQDMCPTQKTTQGPCDLTPPTVSGLRVSGAKIAYSLSEAATVSLQLAKKAVGHRVGGKCVAQTAKNRSKPRCPLFKAVGHGFAGPGGAGADQLTLPNGHKLKPGSYRLTLTAVDVAGNASTKTTSFKVEKPKKK